MFYFCFPLAGRQRHNVVAFTATDSGRMLSDTELELATLGESTLSLVFAAKPIAVAFQKVLEGCGGKNSLVCIHSRLAYLASPVRIQGLDQFLQITPCCPLLSKREDESILHQIELACRKKKHSDLPRQNGRVIPGSFLDATLVTGGVIVWLDKDHPDIWKDEEYFHKQFGIHLFHYLTLSEFDARLGSRAKLVKCE